MLQLIWLIPILPLIGAAINGLLGKRVFKNDERTIGFIASAAVGISFVIAVGAFVQYTFGWGPAHEHAPFFADGLKYTWIPGGHAVGTLKQGFGQYFKDGLTINWQFQLDALSGVMILIVTGVGFLIHVFAVGYMHGETGFYRFFAYLNLFMFMMLVLVLGSNFMMMFVGWEGVGLCSYLLIGYYFEKREAGDAAKKAFVVNRIGDFGFMLAILAIFATFGTLQFSEVGQKIAAGGYAFEAFGTFGLMSWIALGLFVGATGKSAQIPLFIWLPDAMAGPTPVSALIHAATMVTAGVYMVTRTNFIFQRSGTMMFVVALIGALTALVAATIAFTQTDIKKVLAYSTVSQLGYMFLGCGVGAFIFGIFHVMTHAFFKALMFLGSGSVIHGMHHEQDMRRYGGLKKYMPITYRTFQMGWLAICGIIPFAGFFSKDEILFRTFSTSQYFPNSYGKILWVMGFLTAGMTAFYMTRLMALTFWGEYRGNDEKIKKEVDSEHVPEDDPHLHDHDITHGDAEEEATQGPGHGHEDHAHGHGHGQFFPHESPKVMLFPLVVLAVLSVIGGWIGWPGSLAFGHEGPFVKWLEPVIERVVPAGEHAHSPEHAKLNIDESGRARIQPVALQEHAAGAEHSEGEHKTEPIEYLLMFASVGWAVLCMFAAKYVYINKGPFALADKIAASIRPLYVGSKNLWYWNDLWDNKFIELMKRVDNLLWGADAQGVDGAVNGTALVTKATSWVSGAFDKYVVDMLVNLIGWIVRVGSVFFRAMQTGFAQNYMFAIVIGIFIPVVIVVGPKFYTFLHTLIFGS